jgi:hypothetical protein
MWMTTPSPFAAARLVAVAVAVVGVGGCYKPVLDDGGLKCAAVGKKCPDGLKCGSDGLCWQMPPLVPSDASDTKPMSDAGDGHAESMCALPIVTPLCQDAPSAGQTCNPTCQTGCPCGRCNVVGKAAACVAAGAVKLGDLCKLGAADDCQPGLICRKESCGNGLARCYKHCTKNDQCSGSFCQIAINDDMGNSTGFNVCDVAPTVCDPVANTGCPSPSLNCYLTGSNDTLCDCPSNPTKPAQNGEACTFYNDCAGELFCVGGVGGTRCHFVCDPVNPSCPKDATGTQVPCLPVGNAKFGYCAG